MKFLLLAVLSFSYAFAKNNQNKEQAEIAKDKSSFKMERSNARLKRIFKKNTHDHQVDLNKLKTELKEKRQFKIIKFVGNGNATGPVDITNLDSEDPRLLKFFVSGKTPHFKLLSAKYLTGSLNSVLDPVDANLSGSITTANGGFNVVIDISELSPGDYKLLVALEYTLGKNQKKSQTRVSESTFEKLVTDSAHAKLTEIFVHPSNSRVVLDMGESFSDFGNIISYTVETLKDGEVISTQTFDPAIDGTTIFESFYMAGNYQIKLTVADDFQDTDSTLSNTYTVVNPAPSIQFTATQNPEFPDVFEFDLTGTKVEGGELSFAGVYIARSFEASGGQYIELDFVPIFGDRLKNLKFSYKTPARGEIFVGVIAFSAAGVNNFYDFPEIFNIPDQPKESIFLNLSHTFDRSDRPYTKAFAFNAEIDESEVQEFKIKVVDSNGNINQYSQVDPNLDSGFFHVDVDTKGPGDFDIEITLVLKDGRESLPFKTSISFDEVDFGVATLSMMLQFPDQFTSNKVGWIVDLDNSNPGNFGYFNNFYCDFTDVDNGNKFRIEREWTNYDFLVERGNYNVLCFGETTAGLTSSNELKFSIDARNKSPIISSVQSSLIDQNFLKYAINIEANDPDGFIQTVLVKESYSNGTVNEFDVFNYLEVSAQGLPQGDGFVDVELIAVDKEGARSEPYSLNIEFNNLAPSFDIVATLIDENTKEYRFDFQMSDDGYIERQIFTMTSPNGNIYSFDTWNTVNQFLNEATGIWTVQVEGIDNLGKSMIKSIQVEVINKIPEVLALNIYPVNENERLFEIVPDVVDYDGYFIADELIITYPSGNTTRFTPGTGSTTDKLFEPGNYLISYRAQDNSGEWSEVFTTNYSVINKAPIAVFEITQISQDRWFVVTESSYDEDGFIVEHRFEFNGPQGEYITRSESGSFDIQLASPGVWNVGYDVKDNDNEWSARVNSDVEVINEDPVIEISYELVDPSSRTYRFDAVVSDDYGNWRQFLRLIAPDGTVEEIQTAFPVERVLASPGVWGVAGRIVDLDGVEIVDQKNLEVINQAPTIELTYELVDPTTRTYRFDATVADDYGDTQLFLMTTAPDGTVDEVETVFPVEKVLATPGIWEVAGRAVDFDAVEAVDQKTVEVINQAPVINLGYELTNESSSEYTFYPVYKDPDGYIVDARLNVTDPEGNLIIYPVSDFIVANLDKVGLWNATFYAEDQDGAKVEKEIEIQVVQNKGIELFLEEEDVFLFQQNSLNLSLTNISPVQINWYLNSSLVSTETRSIDLFFQEIVDYEIRVEVLDIEGETFEINKLILPIERADTPSIVGVTDIDWVFGSDIKLGYRIEPSIPGYKISLEEQVDGINLKNGSLELSRQAIENERPTQIKLVLENENDEIVNESILNINYPVKKILHTFSPNDELSSFTINDPNSRFHEAVVSFNNAIKFEGVASVVEYNSRGLSYLIIEDNIGTLSEGFQLTNFNPDFIGSFMEDSHNMGSYSASNTLNIINNFDPSLRKKYCPNMPIISGDNSVIQNLIESTGNFSTWRLLGGGLEKRSMELNGREQTIYLDSSIEFSVIKNILESLSENENYSQSNYFKENLNFVFLDDANLTVDGFVNTALPETIFINYNRFQTFGNSLRNMVLTHETVHTQQQKALECIDSYFHLFRGREVKKLTESHAEYATSNQIPKKDFKDFLRYRYENWMKASFVESKYSEIYLPGLYETTFDIPFLKEESSKLRTEKDQGLPLGYFYPEIFKFFNFYDIVVQVRDLDIKDKSVLNPSGVSSTGELLTRIYGSREFDRRYAELLYGHFSPLSARASGLFSAAEKATHFGYVRDEADSLEHSPNFKDRFDAAERVNSDYVSYRYSDFKWQSSSKVEPFSGKRFFFNLSDYYSSGAVDSLILRIENLISNNSCGLEYFLYGSNGQLRITQNSSGLLVNDVRQYLQTEDGEFELPASEFTDITGGSTSGQNIDVIVVNSCSTDLDYRFELKTTDSFRSPGFVTILQGNNGYNLNQSNFVNVDLQVNLVVPDGDENYRFEVVDKDYFMRRRINKIILEATRPSLRTGVGALTAFTTKKYIIDIDFDELGDLIIVAVNGSIPTNDGDPANIFKNLALNLGDKPSQISLADIGIDTNSSNATDIENLNVFFQSGVLKFNFDFKRPSSTSAPDGRLNFKMSLENEDGETFGAASPDLYDRTGYINGYALGNVDFTNVSVGGSDKVSSVRCRPLQYLDNFSEYLYSTGMVCETRVSNSAGGTASAFFKFTGNIPAGLYTLCADSVLLGQETWLVEGEDFDCLGERFISGQDL